MKKILCLLLTCILFTSCSEDNNNVSEKDVSEVKKYLNVDISNKLYEIQFSNRLNEQTPRDKVIEILSEPSLSRMYSLIGGSILACNALGNAIKESKPSETTLKFMDEMLSENKKKCEIFNELHLKYDEKFKEIIQTKTITPFYYFNYKTDDSEDTSTIGLFLEKDNCINFSLMIQKKLNYYSSECKYYKGL